MLSDIASVVEENAEGIDEDDDLILLVRRSCREPRDDRISLPERLRAPIIQWTSVIVPQKHAGVSILRSTASATFPSRPRTASWISPAVARPVELRASVE